MSTIAGHSIKNTLPATGVLLVSLFLLPAAAIAAEEDGFANKFQLRLSSFQVDKSDTDISVVNEAGIGTLVNFADDLGGDESSTIPRLDMHYRFNDRHRIDFANYKIERDGRKLLQIDIDLDEQSYSIGETVLTDITYELLKIGYAYSFYHSRAVELSFTAGLNITSYDFEYELADGSESGSSDVSAPLPMFGLRMSYAITPKFSVHYLTETFFIEVGDEAKGSFFNYELDLRYQAGKNFLLGLGVARLGIDLEANSDEWRGSITDTHRGYLFYVGFQL